MNPGLRWSTRLHLSDLVGSITDLFDRALRLIWARKYLFGFGVLIAILGGVGTADALLRPVLRAIPYDRQALGRLFPVLAPLTPLIPPPDAEPLLGFVRGLGLPGLYWLMGGVLLVVILVTVVLLMLRGALIAGVASPEDEQPVRASLRAGWQRTWRLLIVASIPPIPGTIALNLIVGGLTAYIQTTGGLEAFIPRLDSPGYGLTILVICGLVFIPTLLLTIFLFLLWPLAERACVLDDARAVESYRRAWRTLRANPAAGLVMYGVQWLLNTALSSVALVPGLLVALCAGFVPLLWLLAGLKIALSSTLWTLLWADWTATA